MKKWLKDNSKAILGILVVLTILVLSKTAGGMVSSTWGGNGVPFMDAFSFALMGLVLGWGISVNRRIIRRDIWRYLMVVIVLMMFLLAARTIKYSAFIHTPHLLRYLWYLYYVSIIMIPVFSFFIAEMVGKAEEAKLRPVFFLLFAVGAVLVVLILTNDLHQMAFRFFVPLGDESIEDNYEHGWLFYFVVGWSFSLTMISIGTMVRKNQISRNRRLSWIPVLATLICVVWAILTEIPFGGKKGFFRFTEVLVMGQVLIYETCILIQLIPSNHGYEEYFRNSDVSAMILDEDGKIQFSSRRPFAISAAQREAAKDHMVFLDEATLVQAKNISGGEVVWSYDVSTIISIMNALREMKETLSEKNELLRAENELKEKQARTLEMNRIYDRMLSKVSPALERVEAALDKIENGEVSYEEEIGRVAVIGAYIKRRSNLAIITDEADFIEIEELYLALDESLRYMKSVGMTVYLQKDASGQISSDDAVEIYDTFETVVEEALEKGESCFVRIFRDGEAVRMRLMKEDDVI